MVYIHIYTMLTYVCLTKLISKQCEVKWVKIITPILLMIKAEAQNLHNLLK